MRLSSLTILSCMVLASMAAFADSPYPLNLHEYNTVPESDPDVQSLLHNVHQLEPDIQRVVTVFEAQKKGKNLMLMCNVQYSPEKQVEYQTVGENVRIDYNVPPVQDPNGSSYVAWSIHYDSDTFKMPSPKANQPDKHHQTHKTNHLRG